LSRAEKLGDPPVAVTVMVALRLPLASVVTAVPVDRSASDVAAEVGLITPARGLVCATISKVFAGRPVQTTVTGVPVVLLAPNATGLPL
jgi:hypothetical protein